ncbi:iron (metal) dependent repressor, DtxR family [Lachnospiraceae bacterium G41]|jgi:Mn-dependent DtxR family transcriptional regulator|nr:iron (metal) dependent repressor, DtxR family [Lachnospiraceae bacterium G41]
MALYESGEMYLETILVLYKRGLERVRAIDIVKEMNFSKPSVSIALSNLKKEGYVSVDANGTVELTDAGLKIAKKIYERHVILSQLLVELGVSEKTASEDACRIEHVISDETFKAIKKHYKTRSEK